MQGILYLHEQAGIALQQANAVTNALEQRVRSLEQETREAARKERAACVDLLRQVAAEHTARNAHSVAKRFIEAADLLALDPAAAAPES